MKDKFFFAVLALIIILMCVLITCDVTMDCSGTKNFTKLGCPGWISIHG